MMLCCRHGIGQGDGVNVEGRNMTILSHTTYLLYGIIGEERDMGLGKRIIKSVRRLV